ncbi:transposase [Streptomyces sp. NPDC001833]|uniref:transposase n=1 Tax=Streptomyces sp. NPDC001833 TaxID=3154658 RepID=UPI00331C2243
MRTPAPPTARRSSRPPDRPHQSRHRRLSHVTRCSSGMMPAVSADLSKRLIPDELRELVAPLLPSFAARPQGGGTAPRDQRAVFTAVVYMLTSGCAWRHLPPTFGTSSATEHPGAGGEDDVRMVRTRTHHTGRRRVRVPGHLGARQERIRMSAESA